MGTGTSYLEKIPAPRWFRGLLVIGAMGTAVVGAGIFADSSAAVHLRLLSGMALGLGCACLVLIGVCFSCLDMRIRASSLRFAFGPLGKTLALPDITRVMVECYNWLTYGGWGLRSSPRGRRACSLPGHPYGVGIEVNNGRRRFHVYTRTPHVLAEAISIMILSQQRRRRSCWRLEEGESFRTVKTAAAGKSMGGVALDALMKTSGPTSGPLTWHSFSLTCRRSAILQVHIPI